MQNKSGRTQAKASTAMKRALTNAAMLGEAQKLFAFHPDLKRVAIDFSRYVSPYFEVDGRNLLQDALSHAVKQADFRHEDIGMAPSRFINGLLPSIEVLADYRASILLDDGHWAIWSYDQPLMDWMQSNGRSAMQLRQRSKRINPMPIAVKLLAFIATTRDLDGVELNSLLENRERTA